MRQQDRSSERSTGAGPPDVSALVLAYGNEEWLGESLDAIRGSQGIVVEIIVVDNGTTNPELTDLVERAGAVLVYPERNLGFAGGCNAAARHASAPVLAFVNSDAIVEPDCLRRLAAAVRDPTVGAASAQVVLADDPTRINSIGNPIHVAGISWAGGFGEPASAYPQDQEVAGASGAAMAMRREVWESLGGFWEELFAYQEDTELSLRCWQRGLRVVYVAGAVARHHYGFSRNREKMYLLERNRLLLLLTVWQWRTLLALAPVLFTVELLTVALAVRQGWVSAKLRGWWWCILNAGSIRHRRRLVQAGRTVADRDLRRVLTTTITASNVSVPAGLGFLNMVVRGWCAVAFRTPPASGSSVPSGSTPQ